MTENNHTIPCDLTYLQNFYHTLEKNSNQIFDASLELFTCSR